MPNSEPHPEPQNNDSSSNLVINELTEPFLSEKWFPPTKRFDFNEYSLFHDILNENRRGDLSFKIGNCGVAGMRLDCESDPHHYGFKSVFCHRRICPQCAYNDMIDRMFRYREIPSFVNRLQFDDPDSWKLRFWTFTCRAIPGQFLKNKIASMTKALHRYWLYEYGLKSIPKGGPYKNAGALIVLEVGAGWNVHAHALIYGPYKDVDESRITWQKSLKKENWYGSRLHVENVQYDLRDNIPAPIMELISYPLNPEKMAGVDQELLAHIELGFSGKNKSDGFPDGIRGYRRYIEKGSFYGEFPTPHHNKQMCEECWKHEEWPSEMGRESSYDDFRGRHFQQGYFEDREDRWESRLKPSHEFVKPKGK